MSHVLLLSEVPSCHMLMPGDSKNECPRIEDIERFILVMAERTKTRIRGKGILSLSTMQKTLYMLIDLLTFKFPEFHMTYGACGNRRMKSLFDPLVKDGKLMKGRWSDRPCWVQGNSAHCRLLAASRAGSGLFIMGLEMDEFDGNGLQAACAARAGDVLLAKDTRVSLLEGYKNDIEKNLATLPCRTCESM